jgi:hypothetical protein
MTPSLLIVTMGTDAVAPARMPYELSSAGFNVTLLAPRDALATHTAFVDKIGYFPPDVTLYQWVQAVAGAVRAVRPALILPGDDVAVRTLMQLALRPPEGLRSDVRDELADVVRRSLGPPSSWTDSIDKSRLFDVARRAGVPIADGDVAEREHDAAAIAAHLGYPVIVRPSRGSGGKGSARCDSEAELRSAIRLAPSPDGLDTGEPQRFVIQRFIDGRVVNRAALAWNGVEIAGFTRGRLETHPGPLGPASVVEFVGLPAVRDANLRLFAALDLHGLAGAQYMIEPDRGAALLIEIHRRMLPATHAGGLVGVDLAAALRACVDGVSVDRPDRSSRRYRPANRVISSGVVPRSGKWVARHAASDAPWHDPRLFEAMLKIPYATNAVPVRELISPGP